MGSKISYGEQLTMQFSSLQAFLDMGGYGFYVWLSYGVAALVFITLIISSRSQYKNVLQDIAQREKRKNKLRQAAQQIDASAKENSNTKDLNEVSS